MHFYFQKLKKFYAISASKNLLGDWQISRRYGRVGTQGRTLHEYCSDIDMVQERLEKLIDYRTRLRGYQQIFDSKVEKNYLNFSTYFAKK